jgi:ATP-dependent Clp protease protease subunit
MKMNKILVGLLVALILVLIPRVSTSKDGDSENIVLSKNNILLLNSEVNGESVSQLISRAKELDNHLTSKIFAERQPKKPLYLFINTPGGGIEAGLELIEALKGIGRPINTITLFSASMGFQLVQNLDDRLILKNGVLMSHHAAGEFVGSFGGVQPSQVDNRYKFWLDRIRELDEQTVKRTNGKQTYDSYIKEYDKEMWLTGSKSVSEGYADRIVTVKCDSTLNGTTTKKVQFMGFEISYDSDNCPINTSPINVSVAQPANKVLPSELVDKIKSEFMSQFENKQKQVIPMYW